MAEAPARITGTMVRDLHLCERRMELDLRGDERARDPVSTFVEMLWASGSAHEAAVVSRLEGRIVDLRATPLDQREAATRAALRGECDVVVGGRISHADLLGMPDLLLRAGETWFCGDVKAGSPFEVDGTRPRLEYAVQVATYAAIAEAEGIGDSDRAAVVGADGALAWYDLGRPWGADGLTLAERTRTLIDRARAIRDGRDVTRGALSAACKVCHWRSTCKAELAAADDLTRIAGLGRAIRDALLPVSPTVRDLADLDLATVARPGGRTAVPGLGQGRLARFQHRARLLSTPGAAPYASRDLGLARADRELHFDIEADPTRNGLVYLHGVLERVRGPGGDEERFHHFLAGSPEEERDAFAAAFAFLSADPAARIFYYSRYERTSYRLLQQRYGDVCSPEEVEALFDPVRSTDLLFDVVMPATEWPTSDVSIKTLARHLGFDWSDPDASGAASIAWFHEWVTTGDEAIRDRIVRYNFEDCVATRVLLDGLIALPVSGPPAWPPS